MDLYSKVTGRFAPWTIRPLDVSPPGGFAPWTFRPHVMDVSPPWLSVIKKAQLKSDFNQCSQLLKHSVDFVNSLYVLYAHNKLWNVNLIAEAL